MGGLFLPNWQAQLGVTAWEAGTSCVQGGKGKGRELMVVSVTWGGIFSRTSHSSAGASRSVCLNYPVETETWASFKE